MSRYKRSKREDNVLPAKHQMDISIGSVEDSFEDLKVKCNDISNELIKSVNLADGDELTVVFWTEDFPELIGISTITKNGAGENIYSMDYSNSTIN